MTTLSLDDFKKRCVCIDTEYRSRPDYSIEKVFCVAYRYEGPDAALSFSECIWTGQGGDFSSLLAEIAKRVREACGAEPIFVCHAYELAERRALSVLHCDPDAYTWVDTLQIARALSNAFVERVEKPSLSLAALCKTFLGVCIDTTHKDSMRQLCIDNRTEGHEADISEYCLSDTAHLKALAVALLEAYQTALEESLKILRPLEGSAVDLAVAQTRSIADFARIAERGLPVNAERVKRARAGSRMAQERERERFSEAWPGVYEKERHRMRGRLEKALPKAEREKLDAGEYRYVDDVLSRCKSVSKLGLTELAELSGEILAHIIAAQARLQGIRCAVVPTGVEVPDGELWDKPVFYSTWKRKSAAVQRYMAEFLSGLPDKGASFPRTPTGAICTDAESLSPYEGLDDSFPGALLRHMQTLTRLKGISGTGKSDWLSSFDEGRSVLAYGSMRPFASATGRCQPLASQGFLLVWSKFLYGLLEPPEGKVLVELDYSAEETLIQACVTRDAAYRSVYEAKDVYLWVCAELGLIPKAEYESLPKAELKARYGELRQKIKTFFLAWGYGAGDVTLAQRAGISVPQAQAFHRRLDGQVFSTSTRWKAQMVQRLQSPKLRGLTLPDGWLCRSRAKRGERLKSETSVINWPFQGFGSYVLRKLLRRLVELEKVRPQLEVVATLHDAVLFMCPEGDSDTISEVRRIMIETLDEAMQAPGSAKVGEPEVLHHGSVWVPEMDAEKLERFQDLMQLGEKALREESGSESSTEDEMGVGLDEAGRLEEV